MTKCIFEMLILVQTYIPNMCIFVCFDERLKNGTVPKLVSISNIWSREFIYKENIPILLSQLHKLNMEQIFTNRSSFTSHLFLTRPGQPPPPTQPLQPMILIFSAVCLNPLCICPFIVIVIQLF